MHEVIAVLLTGNAHNTRACSRAQHRGREQNARKVRYNVERKTQRVEHTGKREREIQRADRKEGGKKRGTVTFGGKNKNGR